ncbi:MAG: hypothetical protein ACJAZS_000587 [Alteromonas naphthalenivorans]|jgi:hypothetical protein
MAEQFGFTDRIKRGWLVAMAGWRFILENPSCLIFPIVSVITKVIFALSLIVLYASYIIVRVIKYSKAHPHATSNHIHFKAKHAIPPVSGILLTVVFLFVMILISSIMYTALSYYMAKKIQNTPVSLGASISRAFSRFKTLCVWSLISALLKLIFNRIRKFARNGRFPFNLIASFVGGILNFAWNILTFFVIPIFALKDLSAIASIEESGNTVKKMWGEQLGGTASIGLVTLAALLSLGALAFLPIKLLKGTAFLHHNPTMLFAYFFALSIAGIFVILLSTTATTLFQTTAYLYSQDKTTGPFDAAFIETSFVQKPSN